MKTYRIITDRLVIRCYQPGDGMLLKKSIDESLPELKLWMPWAKNEPETLEEKEERVEFMQEQFLDGIDFTFAVFNRNETELLGSTGLHTRVEASAREIGYWVNSNYIKQGIATEIVLALCAVAFEKENLERLEIKCDKNNSASIHVAQKAGFSLKEILIANAKDVNGNNRDTMIWEMRKEQFGKSGKHSFHLQVFDKNGNAV